jgi:hypothetical protein
MKKRPFVQRLRQPPVLAPAAVISRRPFRLWMTGSLAVVMAAVIPMREVPNNERHNVMRLLRHSPFSVIETVQRIEAAARDGGLSVLAMMPGAQAVLVLESSIGGTLVVMDEADSRPAMPLSMMVREVRGGGAEVLISSASTPVEPLSWKDLPSAVVDDVRALPGLVDRALG